MRRIALLIAAILLLAMTLGAAGASSASAATGPELIPNASLENSEAAPGESGIVEPVDWSPGFWKDTNATWTPTFTYVDGDAHTGTRSVRVEVTGYTSPGDAKWAVDPYPEEGVPVTGNTYYTFSDWYKSDATSAVSVYYLLAGETIYHGHWANLFSGIPAASDWTQYTTGFTMPAGAVRAYFVHFITRNGYLQTDDYSMRASDAPAGFSHSMVSLTFDDGSEAFYTGAYKELTRLGYKTTQYIPTAELGQDDWMMTATQLAELSAAGTEIGSHSVTHPDLTTLPADQLATEVTAPKTQLESIIGKPVVDFAYPFGAYDSRVIDALRTAGYKYARSVEEGYNSQLDLEPFDIRVQNMTSATTIAQFQSWIDYAQAHNYWLVIVYHEVVPDGAPVCTDPETVDPCLDTYATRMNQFKAQLAYINAQGLDANVRTVQQAFTVATNHYPTGTATISPASPTAKDALAATATFTDPDAGDTLKTTYQWFRGDTMIAGATGMTLDLSKVGAMRGDVIRFEASADDSREGEAKATASVIVDNLAPSKGAVAISPSQPVAGTKLTATPSGFGDADGDALDYAYSWYRDGRLISGQSGDALPASEVHTGDAIRVDVRATDGHGGISEAATTTVTVVAPSAAVPAPTLSTTPSLTPPSPRVVDKVAPSIVVTSPRSRTYRVGTTLTVRFSLADSSGVAISKATIRRVGDKARSVKKGAKVHLKRAGTYVLRITATDRKGNTASKTIRFRVTRS